MQRRQSKQRVRKITVKIFSRVKYRPVFPDAKINLKQSEIEHTTVVNEGYDAHTGYDEHQGVEGQVNHVGEAPGQSTDVHRQQWRRMTNAVCNACHERCPQEEAEQGVNIDPERLSLVRPGVMQQS